MDSIGPHDGERLLTGTSGRWSLGLAVGWLVLLLGREALPPMLPAIIEDLAISPSAAGGALTVMWVVYAAAHYPSGRLSDRLTRGTVLVGSLVVALVGFIALALAYSYLNLLIGIALVGIGAGAYFPATRGLLSDLFVKRRGQAIGINIAAGSVGSALAAGLGVLAVSEASWRDSFLPVIGLLLAIIVLFHRWRGDPYVVERVAFGLRTTVKRLFETRLVRRIVIAYTLFAFAWSGVLGFLPTLLHIEQGVSLTVAGGGFALIHVIGIFVGPLAGGVGDRFRRLPVATAALLTSVVGLAAIVLAPTLPLVVIGIALFAIGMRSYPPVMQAYLLDQLPEASVAGDYGAIKTVYTGVGGLGPTYIGLVAEQATYAVAFGGLGVGLIIGTGILVGLSRRP